MDANDVMVWQWCERSAADTGISIDLKRDGFFLRDSRGAMLGKFVAVDEVWAFLCGWESRGSKLDPRPLCLPPQLVQ